VACFSSLRRQHPALDRQVLSAAMLIYVQLFGGAVQRTLPLDVRSDCSVGELQRRIRQLHPELAIKRCIFAGKQLDDDAKTIGQWGRHSEQEAFALGEGPVPFPFFPLRP
jgi:hypothetical protein